jgi:hypothetical protein
MTDETEITFDGSLTFEDIVEQFLWMEKDRFEEIKQMLDLFLDAWETAADYRNKPITKPQ